MYEMYVPRYVHSMNESTEKFLMYVEYLLLINDKSKLAKVEVY